MALVVPAAGEAEMLERIVGNPTQTTNGNVHIHLYKNDYTPIESSVLGDFTELVDATDQNYALLPLTAASWNSTPSNPTAVDYTQQTWTFLGTPETAISVYGYFVTADNDTTLLWAERFTDAPYNIPGTGGSVSVTPILELD